MQLQYVTGFEVPQLCGLGSWGGLANFDEPGVEFQLEDPRFSKGSVWEHAGGMYLNLGGYKVPFSHSRPVAG